MKLTLTCCLLFISTFFVFAQNRAAIEAKIDEFPKHISTPEQLAALIKENFNSDEDKATATYVWLAKNIRYDTKAFFSGKYDEGVRLSAHSEEELLAKKNQYEIQFAETAFKKRTGVCEQYSRLYKIICDAVGVECTLEKGFVRRNSNEIGKIPEQITHAWNKVKIGEEWRGVDATWGSGTVDFETEKFIPQFTYNYCLVPLYKLGLNHLSADFPKKELLQEKKNFAALPLFYGLYIGSEMQIIEPSTGVISLKGVSTVEFKIKDFSKTALLVYNFNSEPSQSILDFKVENDLSTFSILCKNKSGSILNLWLDHKLLVSYRIRN